MIDIQLYTDNIYIADRPIRVQVDSIDHTQWFLEWMGSPPDESDLYLGLSEIRAVVEGRRRTTS